MGAAGDIRAGRAYVELLLKKESFVSGLDAAGKKLSAFGEAVTKIGAAVAAIGASMQAALLAAFNQFGSTSDRLVKLSQRLGTSAEAISELAYAAIQCDTDLATLEQGISRLKSVATAAAAGNAEAAASLAALGVSAQSLIHASPERVLEIMADAIARIPDPAKRAALATKLLGETGAALLPLLSKGSRGLRELRAEAQSLGLTMTTAEALLGSSLYSEMNKAMNKAKLALAQVTNALGKAVGVVLVPKIQAFSTLVTQVAMSVTNWINNNQPLIGSLVHVADKLVIVGTAVVAAGTAINYIGKSLSGMSAAASMGATALSTLLSPMGLITLAIAAGVGYWLKYTESGKQAVEAIKLLLVDLRETFDTTFGGISDALAAGDLELAATIAMAGVRLAFLQGWQKIAEAWGPEIDALVLKLTSTWNDSIKFLTDLWAKHGDQVIAKTKQVAQFFLDTWRAATALVGRWFGDISEQVESLPNSFEFEGAEGGSAPATPAANTEGGESTGPTRNSATLAAANAAVEESKAELAALREKARQAAQDKADADKKRLKDAKSGEDSAFDWSKVDEAAKNQKVEEAEQAAQPEKLQRDVLATFSSAELQGVGNGGMVDRAIKEAEKTNDLLSQLVDQNKNLVENTKPEVMGD